MNTLNLATIEWSMITPVEPGFYFWRHPIETRSHPIGIMVIRTFDQMLIGRFPGGTEYLAPYYGLAHKGEWSNKICDITFEGALEGE